MGRTLSRNPNPPKALGNFERLVFVWSERLIFLEYLMRSTGPSKMFHSRVGKNPLCDGLCHDLHSMKTLPYPREFIKTMSRYKVERERLQKSNELKWDRDVAGGENASKMANLAIFFIA